MATLDGQQRIGPICTVSSESEGPVFLHPLQFVGDLVDESTVKLSDARIVPLGVRSASRSTLDVSTSVVLQQDLEGEEHVVHLA